MFKVACIQLRSDNVEKNNLDRTKKFILQAVKEKADLILTPECSSIFSLNKKKLQEICKNMYEDFYLKEVRILADYAISGKDISVAQAEDAKKRAEKAMKEKTNDRDFAIAELEFKRAILELKAASRKRNG